MRIIIVGAGKVGYTVANQLNTEGHGVTIVEKDEAVLNDILGAIDIDGFLGSGMDLEILRNAGIDEADLFIALTGDDKQNLLLCLLARKLGAKNTIARIRQPEYNGIIKLIAEELGLSLVVNPEKEAAMEIARILELPMARKVETFAHGRVEMVDYDVDEDSPMCGKLIREAFANTRSALICAVARGDDVYIPLGDFRIEQGDVITAIAPTGKIYGFFREVGIKHNSIKRAIISGGGRTSFYLARQLLSQHIRATIIEQDIQVAHTLAEMLPNAEICIGDGTSQSVLDENGISRADAFCCLTGIDEENILTSLYARHISPTIKTVTKLNRVELIPVVKPLGMGSVVSPKMIAADRIISYVRARQNGVGSGVRTLYRIVDNKAEAIEFDVSEESRLIDVPIKNLILKDNVILACINRKGKIISPRGNDALHSGDTVIVVTTHTGFDVLDDILVDIIEK